MKELIIKSPAFKEREQIPKKYGASGEDTNPSLTIQGVPPEAKTLALIMEDPDAPHGTFNHWVVWNIPAATSQISEHAKIGVEGLNSLGQRGYTGPEPPSGTHRYFFKVYALDVELHLDADVSKEVLQKAMSGHVLAEGGLMGLFSSI
jgi:Raf kinase inhibitor-like YbhB/YbcL family protein